MGIKINEAIAAFVCACAGLFSVLVSMCGEGGAWVALVFFVIVESLALVFAWRARALFLGKIAMALAAILIILAVGNTIRFFAS